MKNTYAGIPPTLPAASGSHEWLIITPQLPPVKKKGPADKSYKEPGARATGLSTYSSTIYKILSRWDDLKTIRSLQNPEPYLHEISPSLRDRMV